MATPGDLARRLFADYYIPRLRRHRYEADRVRVAFVTIQSVDSTGGFATALTSSGDTIVWPYMEITPSSGLPWRALMIGRGGWVLDDYARQMST